MAELFGNYQNTTLAAAITTTTATSLTVTSATGFPGTASYRIRIENELLYVTAGAGTTTWTVTRGVEGTVAATHVAGTLVEHLLTAGALVQLKADAIAGISANAPLSVANGIITLPAATTTQNGYMTTSQATQLANATSASTASTIAVRDASSNIFGAYFNSSINDFLAQQPYAIYGRTSADGFIRTFNPANLTAANIVGQANSAIITASVPANANQIVQRDALGHVYAVNLNMTANEGIAATPYMFFGRNSGDTYLRTFNPANVTVGGATNASGLYSGTADGDKLHNLNTGIYAVTTGGFNWSRSYLPNGKRIYSGVTDVGLPAGVEGQLVSSGALPEGNQNENFIMSVSGRTDYGTSTQRIFVALRSRAGTFDVVCRSLDGTNCNSIASAIKVNVIAIEY